MPRIRVRNTRREDCPTLAWSGQVAHERPALPFLFALEKTVMSSPAKEARPKQNIGVIDRVIRFAVGGGLVCAMVFY